jgi:hypothetical protein
MEDWQTFAQAVLPFIMRLPCVPQPVRALVRPLWKAVMFYTTYRTGQEKEVHIRDAVVQFLQYARLVEKTFQLQRLATLKLHVCAVHLGTLARAWGPTCFQMEYWIERMMQVVHPFSCQQRSWNMHRN